MSHLDNLIQYFPDLPKQKVLDVGSGRGNFLVECASRGMDIVGLELNPEYIQIARQKASQANIKINVQQGLAENLPFPDNTFDFINCAEVLEHVLNPEKVLAEIHRVLKPGGKCYMSVHNRFGVYDYHYHLWFVNWLPRAWAEKYISLRSKHKDYKSMMDIQRLSELHYYTYRGFKKLSQKKGFRVVDSRLEKLKKRFFGFFVPLYKVMRIFYFNTFHILLTKQ